MSSHNALISLVGEKAYLEENAKCGFKEFGRRHESRFTDGKYHDMVYMELINKE